MGLKLPCLCAICLTIISLPLREALLSLEADVSDVACKNAGKRARKAAKKVQKAKQGEAAKAFRAAKAAAKTAAEAAKAE